MAVAGFAVPPRFDVLGKKKYPAFKKRKSKVAKNSIIKAMKALRKQTEKEAKAEAKLAKLREKVLREQKEFRDDHKKLAATIAALIRADQRAGEDPCDYADDVTNEVLEDTHWLQDAWGQVVVNEGSLLPVEVPITKDQDNFPIEHPQKLFEVTCPTTGCVAGWAASLAGFPMAVANFYSTTESLQEFIQRNEGQIYQVDNCIDKENNRLVSISDKGAELLRLDRDDKDWLFSGFRSQEEVLWALDQIAKKGCFDLSERPTSGCACCND